MKITFLIPFLLLMTPAFSQEVPIMDFEIYDPVSTLVVPENKVKQAKYPFIDVHNHQFGDFR